MDQENTDWIKYYPEVYEKISGTYWSDRFSNPRGRYDLYETTHTIYELFDCPQTPSSRVLDVGCGPGKVSIPIAKCGARVTCLDASIGMLRQCTEFANKAGVNHLQVTNASADRLPYGPNTFDTVIASRFLHLFPKTYYPTLMNEMLRVVKPGGLVIVEVKNKYFGFVVFILGALAHKHHSSMVSVLEAHRMDRLLTGGKVVKVISTQLPKAQLLPPQSRLTSITRKLARTVLSPIASFHFIIIQKLA